MTAIDSTRSLISTNHNADAFNIGFNDGPAADGSLRLSLDAIAEKFAEYYWPRARPCRAVGEDGFVFQQNTGRQAAVITAYEQGQRAGAHAWIRQDELVGLDGTWRDALAGVPALRVAEEGPPGSAEEDEGD